MTEEGGSGTRLVCPSCGRAREAGGRYCPGCGLDYWRLAAGGTIESAGGPPLRKRRFGRGPREAAVPASAPTPSPTPTAGANNQPGPIRSPGVRYPSEPASAGASGTLPERFRQATASVQMPQSPRARLLASGLVAAVLLLVVLGLVMRPASPAATGPTTRPTPSGPAPDAVIAAFFKAVRDPAAAFEVNVKGTFTQTINGKRTPGTMVADMRIAGDSLSGTLRVAQPTQRAFNGSIVRIGDRSWTRGTSGAWRQQVLPAAADAVNPFAWIATVDDVTYLRVGPDVAGKGTNVLQSTKWLSGTQYDDTILQLADAQRDSRMEVVVTNAGVPLRATYQFTIRGTLSTGSTLLLAGSTQFTFTKWGEASTIGPPA